MGKIMYKGVDYSAPTASGVSGVKGDAESTYRMGNVNITPANIGLGNVNNTSDSNKSVKYATSAGSAAKATQDGNGKTISSTYLPLDGGTVTGRVLHKEQIVCENTYDSKYRRIASGIGFMYDSDTVPIIPNEGTGYGGNVLYDGLICASNIDQGAVEYVAKGYGSGCHDFYTVDNDGTSLGYAYIESGHVYAKKYNTFGGDYAENWEYEDGNIDNEDRVGLFVTFTGNKIRIAQKGDNLAKVGVVSATPSIVGNSDGKEWTHKYLKDVYGREIWQNVEHEDGTVSKERVLNPEYDETLKYIKRKDRSEWDAVGTHGKLVVRDDGTCYPDGFCVPADGGIATASETGFYVMERLDESHVRIYMK